MKAFDSGGGYKRSVNASSGGKKGGNIGWLFAVIVVDGNVVSLLEGRPF